MIATVWPGPLRGTVRVPASKSAAHRALICAALAEAPTLVRIGALNDDIEATINCLTALLGTRIERGDDGLRVVPGATGGKAPMLDCGESGSTLRFLLPLAATREAQSVFIGRGRLPERPNRVLTDALRAHGADIDADLLPMRVRGPIHPGLWELPGNVSSQYITGLLFALVLLSPQGESEIRLTTALESAAYVEMTVAALERFGVRTERTESGWRVPAGQRFRSPGECAVEGDWSAAAFWLAANATGSRVTVEGLDENSVQGDRAVALLLGRREIDARNVPDLVPALAVAAAALPQRTVITGAARLRLKESDRLASVADMVNALGARAVVTEDGLVIDGRAGGSFASAEPVTVDGANDHRIVMATAIAATSAGRPVRVTDAGAVSKSYPDFFRDFKQLGGHVDVELSGR